jgi:hypothetical protein
MRWVVGLLLVSAAILKAAQFITEPTTALVYGRLLPSLQVGVELGVGLVALNGFYWRRLRWFALLLFVGFAGYSLLLATNGVTSCACFGAVRVHPWWTFGLDLAVVFGLLLSILAPIRVPLLVAHRSASSPRDKLPSASTPAPEEGKQCDEELGRRAPHGRLLVAAAMAVAILIIALFMRNVARTTATAKGVQPMASDITVLEPEQWIGKQLPIADFIDLGLSSGEWTVLLHRHDCPDCLEAVPRYEELALRGTRVALVEVPPYGDGLATQPACYYGRLTDEREWFLQTPVEIQLQDGIVTSVKSHDH